MIGNNVFFATGHAVASLQPRTDRGAGADHDPDPYPHSRASPWHDIGNPSPSWLTQDSIRINPASLAEHDLIGQGRDWPFMTRP